MLGAQGKKHRNFFLEKFGVDLARHPLVAVHLFAVRQDIIVPQAPGKDLACGILGVTVALTTVDRLNVLEPFNLHRESFQLLIDMANAIGLVSAFL